MDEYNILGVEKEPTLKEKINKIYSALGENKEKQRKKDEPKKLKLPRKAKVGKSRKKKGYCGILFLNENKTIQGQKVKLEGGTYKTKDNNYHVTNGSELLFWEGKYPILWQRHDKLNPTEILTKKVKNEIYGQDLVMLRMKKDLVKEKKKGGMSILYIILLLVGGYFVLKMFFPSLFGG